MTDTGKKDDRAETRIEEAQALAETCRGVMWDGMPEGCSGMMREMMSRWVEGPGDLRCILWFIPKCLPSTFYAPSIMA